MASPSDLIVITSVSGMQGAHLIPLLYGNYPLRLVTRSSPSADRLKAQFPDAEVVQADLVEPANCRRIVKSAVVVYHIGPSLHPHETQIGYNMIDACANEPSLKHFVFSSVYNTQFRKMFNHDRKRYVEEYLFESELNYTVIKPSDFMDWSIPISAMFAKEPNAWGGAQPDGSGRWKIPWRKETPSSLTALRDLAEASVKIIIEREKHFLAEYPVTSTMPLSRIEMASLVEKTLGQKVEIVEPKGVNEAVESLTKHMFGDEPDPLVVDGMERLILFYHRRGLRGNPNVLRWLLGREPTSPVDYIKSEAARIGL